jgi:hypothetical protein
MTPPKPAASVAVAAILCGGAAPSLYTETILKGGHPYVLTQPLTGNDDPEVVSLASLSSNAVAWYAPVNPGKRLPPTATLAAPAGFKYAAAQSILTNGTPLLVAGAAVFNASNDLQAAVWLGNGFTPSLLPNYANAPYLGTNQRAYGAGAYLDPISNANYVLVAGNATGAKDKAPTKGVTNASFWTFPATAALAINGQASPPTALATINGEFGVTKKDNYVAGVVNAPYNMALSPVVFGYSVPAGSTRVPVLWDLTGIDPTNNVTTPASPQPLRLDTPVLAKLPLAAPFNFTAAQVRGYSVNAGAWCLDLDCESANVYGQALIVGSVIYQPTGSSANSSVGVIWYYQRGVGVAAFFVPPAMPIITGSGGGALSAANQVLTLYGVNSDGQVVGQQIQRSPVGYAGLIAPGTVASPVPTFLTSELSMNRMLAPYAQVVDASAINEDMQIIAVVNNGNSDDKGYGALLSELK